MRWWVDGWRPVKKRLLRAAVKVLLLLAHPLVDCHAFLPIASDFGAVFFAQEALQRVSHLSQTGFELIGQVGVTILEVEQRG